ncbi:putative type VI secretion system effector [Iodobacter sp. CM08]|uniref:putative type VI secretion system effector n=1 Tax=Iodobacter sp. CM08 TaxID=3085902 RepID=UPI00298282DE|nr:putative type VI secretion system effector [Iodobacter sp. CM08]MDW5419221.1 putative type VI secretion system effector [Iodobacter sp. CM08]
MKLKTDRGIIENLQIVRTQQNILYSPHMKEAAGVSAIVFAVAGMGAAAVQTSANSEGGADEVDMYSFDINGVQYAGCTRVAGFKNGDEIELVYEDREQGAEVLGLRRSSSRSIWLYPYMSRGSLAGVISGIKLWLLFSSAIVIGVLLLAAIGWDGSVPIHVVVDITIMGFALIAIGVSWMLPRLYHFSIAANKVFTAFGFENPKWVDLHKTSKAFRKKNNVPWNEGSGLELWY